MLVYIVSTTLLYILLNVTLYFDIGVARALYVAVVAHSKKNTSIHLTMRVRPHKYRFVCACTCDYLSEARERTLHDYSLSSALAPKITKSQNHRGVGVV